jgi:hypothetical protein
MSVTHWHYYYYWANKSYYSSTFITVYDQTILRQSIVVYISVNNILGDLTRLVS